MVTFNFFFFFFFNTGYNISLNNMVTQGTFLTELLKTIEVNPEKVVFFISNADFVIFYCDSFVSSFNSFKKFYKKNFI